MADVSTYDSRFRVADINRDGMTFFDAESEPFRLYGVFRDGDHLRRMPQAVSNTVSEAVNYLASHTAGGRVRFATDSTVVAVYVQLYHPEKMPHFALTGSIGCDIYVDDGGERGSHYVCTCIPPFDVEDAYEAQVGLGGGMKEITIHLPLYGGVRKICVGVAEGATLQAPKPYRHELPVVYYGSSITQGGCASRPGNTYQAILTRELDCDHVNLGFSGSALGEPETAAYIASLPMSVFVLDYDHNAPTAEHLKRTHFPMYQTVRNAKPDVPIIMMSRPTYYRDDDEIVRMEIIRETYERAKAAGDERVYFIDGGELIGKEFAECAKVDGAHPNDCGFFAMAKRLRQTLEPLLENNI